jgi:hypothetical protein
MYTKVFTLKRFRKMNAHKHIDIDTHACGERGELATMAIW